MKNLKILIVEDEVLIAEDLKDTLLEFGVLEIEMAHNKIIAFKQIKEFEPDIVLLDIRMKKELDGLDVGKFLMTETIIPFIYITAHSDVAMIKDIIKTKPISYITKPFKTSDLFASITLAMDQIQQLKDAPKQIKLDTGTSTQMVNSDDILYIESEGNYICVYCTSSKFTLRQSLDSIANELGNKHFFRIQRSYLINLNKISAYTKKTVTINGIELRISRALVDEFEARLNSK
jgi:two-component system, LytTR family, response regulator LytT